MRRIDVIMAGVLTLGWATAGWAQVTAEQKQTLANYFGFGEMEIYKLDNNISNLQTADMNGDGLTDLIVVNNYKSKIDVLLQRKEKPTEAAVKTSSNVNELENDWRLDRRSIPINYHVHSLAVGELTGDKYPDLVFFGDPKELVVLKNNGDGTFAAPVGVKVRDGLARPGSVVTGDLNHDGLTDVALLGEKDVLLFYQNKGGGLGRPLYSAHAESSPLAIDIADINGDGRDDLIIVPEDDIRVQLQTEDGQLGPIQRIRIPAIRTWDFYRTDRMKQAEMIGVEKISGRFKRWVFERTQQAGGIEEWPVLYYPFTAGETSNRRPIAIGDVNGDGLDDLVAADVNSAQLLLYTQKQGVGLEPPHKFGGQVNMRDLRCMDLNGDHRAEVLACSADEKSIGVSVWQNNHLTFPRPISTVGSPQCFDIVPVPTGHRLVYVTEESGSYFLVSQSFQTRIDGDQPTFVMADDQQKIKIDDVSTAPSAMRLADANQDGVVDVLIFTPYEPLITFLQNTEGQLERLTGASAQLGLVKEATVAGFTTADVNRDGKPEIILAQKMFARALRINDQKQWEVVDQFNAPTEMAEIIGVTAIAESGQTMPQIVLYDKRNLELHWLAADAENTYQVSKSVPISSFELSAMETARLTGAGTDNILVSDNKKFALALPNQPPIKAADKSVFESKTKDARLWRTAVGDLNHDGRTDFAVIEGKEHQIEILTQTGDGEVLPAIAFKAFDAKTFQREQEDNPEPRELRIADLNGDGHDDLAIIVHDRVIIYPGQ